MARRVLFFGVCVFVNKVRAHHIQSIDLCSLGTVLKKIEDTWVAEDGAYHMVYYHYRMHGIPDDGVSSSIIDVAAKIRSQRVREESG